MCDVWFPNPPLLLGGLGLLCLHLHCSVMQKHEARALGDLYPRAEVTADGQSVSSERVFMSGDCGRPLGSEVRERE